MTRAKKESFKVFSTKYFIELFLFPKLSKKTHIKLGLDRRRCGISVGNIRLNHHHHFIDFQLFNRWSLFWSIVKSGHEHVGRLKLAFLDWSGFLCSRLYIFDGLLFGRLVFFGRLCCGIFFGFETWNGKRLANDWGVLGKVIFEKKSTLIIKREKHAF